MTHPTLKWLIAPIITLLLAASALSAAPGDIDAQNGVTIKDAVLALQICAGMAATGDPAADVDGDGRIGLEEALFVLRSVSKTKPVKEIENYTHQLDIPGTVDVFWTTPPSERVFKDAELPSDTGLEVLVYAARNEFEPFQIVIQAAASKTVEISVGDFGSGIEAELFQVKYAPITQATDSLGRTGDYPDPLWPLETGATVSLNVGENTAFWVSLFVPKTAPAGDHFGTVAIGGVDVPVKLHVFDFAIPDELHVKSQMNFSHKAVLDKYGVSDLDIGDEYWMYVDMMKQFFIDHRLTSKSPLWSGGLTSGGGAPYIDYCETKTLSDPHGIWGFEEPAKRYLDGAGLMKDKFTKPFNDGTGYPSFMAATFRNNYSSQDQRPDTFCDITRSAGDWYEAANPDTAYNQAWFEYINAIQEYLRDLGYLDKAYYYFANEPQDQADYDAVAWYSQELKKVAPDLKLMVSEDPKPEIFNHPQYADAKIDIWLPVLHSYDPEISLDREANHGEETWIYFLHGTRPPYFNPITLDHPGIESKLTGWFLWKYRVRGIAYYSMNNWNKNPWTDPLNSNHNGDLFMLYPPSEDNSNIAYGANKHRMVPSIRFELMRDSLEDYEYLYLLNGGEQPAVNQANSADVQADKIVSGVASYTRDGEFMYNLRRLIGLKLSGKIVDVPDIQPPASHPRAQGPPGNYYINFQDPEGEPTADPLIVDGKTYMKIGINEYDEQLGYGWFGGTEYFLTGYDPWGTETNVLKMSCAYDNNANHPVTFEFDLPSGTYDVEVCVGAPRDPKPRNKVIVEGVVFIDDEPANNFIIRQKRVTVADAKLTLEIGIKESYTLLDYLKIEAASD